MIGVLNQPGTVLLTISDMSVVEAELEVDETSIPSVKVGQEALRPHRRLSEPDLHRHRHGGREQPDPQRDGRRLTRPSSSGQGPAQGPARRTSSPGSPSRPTSSPASGPRPWSCRIQALVVRDIERKPGQAPKLGEPRDEEGVYLMEDGKARFQAVKTGLIGELSHRGRVRPAAAARRSSPGRSSRCGPSSPATREAREAQEGRRARRGLMPPCPPGSCCARRCARCGPTRCAAGSRCSASSSAWPRWSASISVITGLNAFVKDKVIQLAPDVYVVTKFGIIRSREEFLDALKRPRPRLERLRGRGAHAAPGRRRWRRRRCGNTAVKYRDRRLADVQRAGHHRELRADAAPRHRGRPLLLARRGRRPRSPSRSSVRTSRTSCSRSSIRSAATMLVGGAPYRVIGLLAKQGRVLGEERDRKVFIPIHAFRRQFGTPRLLEHPHQGAGRAWTASTPRWTRCARSCARCATRRFRGPDPFGVVTAESLHHAVAADLRRRVHPVAPDRLGLARAWAAS